MTRLLTTLAGAAGMLVLLAWVKADAPVTADEATAATTSLREEADLNTIAWLSWEEAVAANVRDPRPLIVDVYTDWCGWCKRMDATTFRDPAVVKYVSDRFHPVKLNAEQTADISYDGHTFKYQRSGARGVHELAASLLDNRLSYPSIVYLNPQMERVMIAPGFKDADAIMRDLKYATGEGERP